MNPLDPQALSAYRDHWRNRLVDPIVPPGEGPGKPYSIRFPEGLLRRIDACAKATGNNRSETILHLLRWALEKFEEQRRVEKSQKG